MGERGPIPKRSHEQAGHQTKEQTAERLYADGDVPIPEPEEMWSYSAHKLYDAAKESAMAVYYEPSDWAYLHYVCELITVEDNKERKSPENLKTIFNCLGALGFTEGDRRRMRIEVERGNPNKSIESAKVTTMAKYRRAAGG